MRVLSGGGWVVRDVWVTVSNKQPGSCPIRVR